MFRDYYSNTNYKHLYLIQFYLFVNYLFWCKTKGEPLIGAKSENKIAIHVRKTTME